MNILDIILGFLAKIFGDVIKDVLSSPAKEISIEEADGDLDLPSTPADDVLSEYGMFDRG